MFLYIQYHITDNDQHETDYLNYHFTSKECAKFNSNSLQEKVYLHIVMKALKIESIFLVN